MPDGFFSVDSRGPHCLGVWLLPNIKCSADSTAQHTCESSTLEGGVGGGIDSRGGRRITMLLHTSRSRVLVSTACPWYKAYKSAWKWGVHELRRAGQQGKLPRPTALYEHDLMPYRPPIANLCKQCNRPASALFKLKLRRVWPAYWRPLIGIERALAQISGGRAWGAFQSTDARRIRSCTEGLQATRCPR